MRISAVAGLPLAAALCLSVSGAALAQQATGTAPAAGQSPSASQPAQGSSGTKLPEVQIIQEQPKPKVETAEPPAPPKKKKAAATKSDNAPPPAPKKAAAPKPEPVAAEPAPAVTGYSAQTSENPGTASPAFGTNVQMSPIAGSGIPVEKVPAAVSTVSGGEIARAGQSTLESALERRVPGVAISDPQGNSFNTTVEYRGFIASPLPGMPQGIAVYQNGVRINETWGDIVNFDALPSNAISSATIMSANPVFGLNAIGGSMNIKMKDGFEFQGVEVDSRFGSFSRRQVGVQAGMRSGPWAAYFASEFIHDGGYRDYSTSNIRREYADLGVKGDGNELHVSVTNAQNDVGVAAATPWTLLELSRRLTFSTPQVTHNEVTMVQLNGTTLVTPNIQLSSVLYGRFFDQNHVDGNIAEIRRCGNHVATPPGSATIYENVDGGAVNPANGNTTGNDKYICESEGTFREAIRSATGNPIIDPQPAAQAFGLGTIDRTEQHAKTFGGSGQLTDKDRLFGFANQFLIGASYDHGHVRYRSASELATGNASLVMQGTGIILGGDDYGQRSVSSNTDYIGVFFSNTIDLTDKLAFTVGGRFNFAHLELFDGTGDFPDITSSHTFQRFNPQVGATYKLFPGLTVYAGYSEANRAPTPGELACADPVKPCVVESFLTDDPPLKQVISRTVETGLKGELNGIGLPAQINWGLGFFHTVNQDDIIAISSPNIQGRGYFQNAGETLRQGYEANIEARAARWFAYANYTYVDATYQSQLEIPAPNNPWNTRACSAPANGDINNCAFVMPGNQLPGISPHRFKVGAEYEILPAWKLGLDWNWQSSQRYFGDEGNVAPKIGAHNRLDLHTSYDITSNVQIYGIVNNLLNQKYDLYGTYFSAEAADNSTGRTIRNLLNVNDTRSTVPAAPLAAYGGLKVKF